MVHVFNSSPRVMRNMMQNVQNKSRKWFTVSGRSKQASKQANMHTQGRNEVTLVWGSLRLAQ